MMNCDLLSLGLHPNYLINSLPNCLIILTFAKVVKNSKKQLLILIMYNKEDKILIIGAGGQIGIELTQELSVLYGSSNVIAADLKPIPALDNNPFETLDI